MTELAGNEELQHVIDRSNLELIFTDYKSGQWNGKMFQDILDWHTHEVEKRITASHQQLLRELEGQKKTISTLVDVRDDYYTYEEVVPLSVIQDKLKKYGEEIE